MENKESGKRLKSVAVALGISVAELGQSIGVKSQQMYDWSHGKFIPRFEVWVSIAQKYPNVSADYLLRGQGEILT